MKNRHMSRYSLHECLVQGRCGTVTEGATKYKNTDIAEGVPGDRHDAVGSAVVQVHISNPLKLCSATKYTKIL